MVRVQSIFLDIYIHTPYVLIPGWGAIISTRSTASSLSSPISPRRPFSPRENGNAPLKTKREKKQLCYFKALTIVKSRNWLSAIRSKMAERERGDKATSEEPGRDHSYYRINLRYAFSPRYLLPPSAIPFFSRSTHAPPPPFLYCSWARSDGYGYWKLIAKEWWTFNQSRRSTHSRSKLFAFEFIFPLHLCISLCVASRINTSAMGWGRGA